VHESYKIAEMSGIKIARKKLKSKFNDSPLQIFQMSELFFGVILKDTQLEVRLWQDTKAISLVVCDLSMNEL
jgi:hypothetical protein